MTDSNAPTFPTGNMAKPGPGDLLIVGLGASAGGIQALQEFFEHVQQDSGIAYVVILHLSPDHDSKLAEVLQVVSPIPIKQVTKSTKVEPNHVYVVPPNQHLVMVDGIIEVTKNLEIEDRRAPVDIFFRTLAETHGPRAVCVVLSGTGANGSMGLKRIKEMGGAAFVQNPREAEFNEMPRSSIATELVDDVLNVAQIPERILEYKNSLGAVQIAVDNEQQPEEQQKALREIFSQLRMRMGHDFTNYKRPTLMRRIERRVIMRNLPNLPAYVAYIRQNPDEISALLKDLLISVTNFFRDQKAFGFIKDNVLPAILKSKSNENQVRIWVAGCATGEEAYSIAMLCADLTMSVIDAPKVQIFATDIDEGAISNAREGFYTINDAADVPPEYLSRFFNKEGEGYRIRREIREMILFANHNFIKDPPFSHLDLISCRNVMIYLNRTAQERVMETFHFALNPGGFLFLGSSESADGASDLYSLYNREFHVFQSRPVAARNYPVPESVPTFKFDLPHVHAASTDTGARTLDRITFGDLHQRLLEEYAPPSVIINEDYDIVHLSERAGRYLQMAGGEPSQNLLKLVRHELRLELRSALYQAVQKQTAVDIKSLKVNIDERVEAVNIHVRPVLREGDVARGFILVIFEKSEEDIGASEIVLLSEEPVARHLEEELIRLKTQLRVSIEQHEFHAEELKASNEELQAMNEELRSAAEELETSKEELQSINEELRTVNQELKVKIDETSLTSNNLQNLINSASIGTIFLDRSFRIALFTPAAREIFNLIPSDYGRPLSDITHRLDYDEVQADALTVLEKLQAVEREVRTEDGRVFIMRLLPYRTTEDRINGVVITFIDITSRNQAEQALRDSEERYRMLFNSIDEGYCIIEAIPDETREKQDYRFILVNTIFEHQTGIRNATGKLLRELFDPQVEFWLSLFKKVAETPHPQRFEINNEQTNQYFDVYAFPISETSGQKLGILINEITERKLADQLLRENELSFRTLADSVPQLVWAINREGKTVYFNQRWFNFSGLTQEDSAGPGWTAIIHHDDADTVEQYWKQALAEGKPFEAEYRLRRHDGIYLWHIVRIIPLRDIDGHITRWFGSATDIEDLKLAEEYLRESKERLQATMESATDFAIITLNTDGIIEGWSSGAENIFGYKAEEVMGKPGTIIFTPEDRKQGVPEKEMEIARQVGRAMDERWHLRKDGSRFFMSGVMAPLNDGELSGYVKVARDMTARKAADQALRLSEERHRIALQSADMAAWDWDIVRDKVAWNDQHYHLFGIPPGKEEVDSTFFLSFVHPDDKEEVNAMLKAAVNETGLYEAEFRIIRKDDGKVRWMNSYGRAVISENGKATRMVGVMFDITERKLMERQKDEFIGIASHELKTPVTGIKSYVEMLQTMVDEEDGPKIRLIRKLDAQVDRLIFLIRDLLDITRISEGQLELNFEDFQINDLIHERVEDLTNLSTKHRLVFFAEELPRIRADRERIGQALTNLISNAIKYSPEGGEITIRSSRVDSMVRVSVKDRGIGIPTNLKTKVFDRFFRINGPEISNYAGMGLGLYITSEIVHRHGGTIEVDSQVNEGSTFIFSLPLKK